MNASNVNSFHTVCDASLRTLEAELRAKADSDPEHHGFYLAILEVKRARHRQVCADCRSDKPPQAFAIYMNQVGLDDFCQALYKLQAVVDLTSSDRPASDLPTQLLSEIRRQAVLAGAEDPYTDLAMTWGTTEGVTAKRGGA